MKRVVFFSKPKDLYIAPYRLERYSIAYNLESLKGVALLDKKAVAVLAEVNHKTPLQDILTRVSKKRSDFTSGEIINILEILSKREVVYQGEKPTFPNLYRSPCFSIWLHVTNQCNLRCIYCFVSKSAERLSFALGKKTLDDLIKTVKNQGIKEIAVRYAGGEPLLELPLIERLHHYAKLKARKHGLKYRPSIITNGTLINNKIARFFKKEKFSVGVSLDGLGKFNDLNRPYLNGRGSFKDVIRGMHTLQKNQLEFSVGVTITKNNIANLPALQRYLLKRDISVNYNFFRDNQFAKNNLACNQQTLIEGVKKAYREIEKNVPLYPVWNFVLDRVTFWPKLSNCSIGKEYVVVSQKGKIALCPFELNSCVGHVFKETDFTKTLRNYHFPKVTEKEICKDCQWRYICCGGCPGLTYDTYGRYDTTSPFCEVYKALIPEAIKLEALRILKYSKREQVS